MLSTDIKYLKTDAPTIFFREFIGSSWFFIILGSQQFTFPLPRLVALVSPSPTSAPVGHTSAVPMGTATGWCPCCGTSTRRPGMWTKGAASARDPSPCALGISGIFGMSVDQGHPGGFSSSRRDGFLLCFWLEIKSYSCNS